LVIDRMIFGDLQRRTVAEQRGVQRVIVWDRSRDVTNRSGASNVVECQHVFAAHKRANRHPATRRGDYQDIGTKRRQARHSVTISKLLRILGKNLVAVILVHLFRERIDPRWIVRVLKEHSRLVSIGLSAWRCNGETPRDCCLID